MARALNPLAAGLPKSANHQNPIPPQGVNLPTANSGKQKPHKGYACLPPAVGKQKPSLLDASKPSICKKLSHPARGKSAPRRLRGSRAAIGSGGKKPCPFCKRKRVSTSAHERRCWQFNHAARDIANSLFQKWAIKGFFPAGERSEPRTRTARRATAGRSPPPREAEGRLAPEMAEGHEARSQAQA